MLCAITFQFRPERLGYLFESVRTLVEFPIPRVDVVVVTNCPDGATLVQQALGPLFRAPAGQVRSLDFLIAPVAGDPWLLTWCHKPLLSERFMADEDYTHFLYLEEDIRFSIANFRYFLDSRPRLAAKGLIPSFMRVEYSTAEHRIHLTDQREPQTAEETAFITVDGKVFASPKFPYNAMYLLDRQLAAEHIASSAFHLETSAKVAPHWWGVAERAAMGLCFVNAPPGFASRYVVPTDEERRTTLPECWVHHIPNNYAANPFEYCGKLQPDEMWDIDAGIRKARHRTTLRYKAARELARLKKDVASIFSR